MLDRLRQSEACGKALVAADREGDAIGFGHIWIASAEEARCFVRVRPAARGQGAGSDLLRDLVAHARTTGAGVLTLTSWAADRDAEPLLAAQGFEPVRHFVQMRIDLADAAAPAELPQGIEIRPYRPGPDDDELWHAFTDAFADHWGQAAVERGHWWHENRDGDTAGFDAGLWFLAWSGQTIAGFAICRVREDEGEPIGWVSLVGVRPRWRGRGLGHALLTRSLAALRTRGLSRAGLSVDAANTSGALRLYEKAGMTAYPAFTAWSLDLGGTT